MQNCVILRPKVDCTAEKTEHKISKLVFKHGLAPLWPYYPKRYVGEYESHDYYLYGRKPEIKQIFACDKCGAPDYYCKKGNQVPSDFILLHTIPPHISD